MSKFLAIISFAAIPTLMLLGFCVEGIEAAQNVGSAEFSNFLSNAADPTK
jgi:hypothetical protein